MSRESIVAADRLAALERRLAEARILWAAVAAAQAGFIFWSSSRTWSGGPAGWPWFSNFMHFPLYGLLGGAAALALGLGTARRPLARALAGIGLAVTFGALDEWHQSFVPGRSADPMDVVTDLCGAGFAVLFLCYRLLPERRGLALGVGLAAAFTGAVLAST